MSDEKKKGSGTTCATCDDGYVSSHDEQGEEHIFACPDCHATGKRPINAGERVAIVGSRKYPDLEQVRAYVRKLPKGTLLVSGGANGVDMAAEREAKKLGMDRTIFLPDYDAFGTRAPLVRNKHIVVECDRLVAFWDGKSTGTQHVVRLAREAGKPVELWTAGREIPRRTVNIKHCSCGGPFGCDVHP